MTHEKGFWKRALPADAVNKMQLEAAKKKMEAI